MATLLLDTNVLLWISSGSERLGAHARLAIENAVATGEAAFSAISVWEAAMLVRKRRYAMSMSVERWRADLIGGGFAEAPLDGVAARLAAEFADLHADPADRMIAATAMSLSAQLVTSDARLIDWFSADGRRPALDARV